MRKIEKEMIAAVKDRRNWKSGNTEVFVTQLGDTAVKLHGSTIAVFMHGIDGHPCNTAWQKWPTRTTASRLRALGFVYDKALNRWN